MKTERLMVLVLGFCCAVATAQPVIKVERVPEGGVQPQSVTTPDGTVHLVYLKGDARGSDVMYTVRKAGEGAFQSPVRVNHQAGSAVAAGTIRGAQIALGGDGAVHVIWNGSQSAQPRVGKGSPLLYARKAAGEKAFEAERNLMSKTFALDGGGSIAAGPDNQVYVAWHAARSAQPGKDIDRAAFLAVSTDGGKTFGAEREISPDRSGSCACCGLRLGVDDQGGVNVLFRAAFSALDRDLLWLRSADQGKRFAVVQRDAWKIGQCPMSSAWLRDGWAAWEVEGKVKFTRTDRTASYTPAGDSKRKHPVAVQGKDGRSLLLWTEGTGWQKGGAVVWQVVDDKGRPVGPVQRRNDLPVWGLATAWAEAGGGWVVLY